MKLMYAVLMSVALTACGGDDSPTNNTNQSGNTPTPDSNPGTVNTNPTGSTGAATHGFGPIQAREGNQPDDIDDWYNLYWFDPATPSAEATIADWQNAVANATAETELLFPILIQYLSDIYSNVEAGIVVSDDPVVQALAVAAHDRINALEVSASRECVDIQNGAITSWSCAGGLKFIYEVPNGGKLLVNTGRINTDDLDFTNFELGNTDSTDAEKGYGVEWNLGNNLDTQLINRQVFTSVDNPTANNAAATNRSAVNSSAQGRGKDVQTFNAAAYMMRALRTGQY